MKRISTIVVLVILSFILGWGANKMFNVIDDKLQKRSSKILTDSSKYTLSKPPKKKTIHDYISDVRFIYWSPKHPDTTGYQCEITLHEITALYVYHRQCGYDYFTYITSDTSLDIIWSYREDCMLNMDFLEKSNGIKKYPKRGDNFATMTLLNDSTLNVKYNFPEWTKKVNEIVKDSLFPTYYYLWKEN